jgi:hypothetical protein
MHRSNSQLYSITLVGAQLTLPRPKLGGIIRPEQDVFPAGGWGPNSTDSGATRPSAHTRCVRPFKRKTVP